MTDARNFLLNTDYPLDKVAYLFSDSHVFDGSVYFQFPHNLPFTPLVDIVWSYDVDFSRAYFMNAGPPPTVPYSIYDLQVTVESDASNIYINCTGPASSKLAYYRIFAFMPDDVSLQTITTSTQADRFVLNTDLNYTKLFKIGHFTYAANTDVNVDIAHGLGYKPYVQSWQSGVRTGIISACGDDINGMWQIEVTENDVIYHLNQYSNLSGGTIYYRIYAD